MKERDYNAEIAYLVFERDSRQITESLAGKLAILLHDHTCGFNHTDGCGWMYESKNGLHDWAGSAHQMFFVKAEAVIAQSVLLQNYRKQEAR